MLERLEDRTVPTGIASLSPNYGPLSGNTGVAINGSGFTGATSVMFGGTSALGYTVFSDTLIEASSPPEPAGVVDVVVASPSGTSPITFSDRFTYQLSATSTTLASSANPSTFGQPVTFTATVSTNGNGPPSGTVTFDDGPTVLGTGTLSPNGYSDQATFTTSTLALGTHLITAIYGGNSNFAGSTSSALTQNVNSATAFIWFGTISSDWFTAGNWHVNGSPAMTLPGVNDDVLFSGAEGTTADSVANGPAISIHSITIDSSYTGTVHLLNNLGVGTGGFTFEGGAIDQPGTTIQVTNGFINWTGGVLNTSATLGFLFAASSPMEVAGPAHISGSQVIADRSSIELDLKGPWTFTNNAGILMKNSAVFNWNSPTAKLATAGTGKIENDSGTFQVATGGLNVVTSDLPYDNEGGILDIQIGILVFDRVGAQGTSVLQNSGTIILGQDNLHGAILEVDQLLTMNGGFLYTADDELSKITVGNINITGGVVTPGGNGGIGDLKCDGVVSMTGGTYVADVDLTTNDYSTWDSNSGFHLGTASILDVVSLHIPVNYRPPGINYAIIATSARNSLTGDFGTKNLHIGNTNFSYTAGVDAANMNYIITS
jgi:hypothetical protein